MLSHVNESFADAAEMSGSAKGFEYPSTMYYGVNYNCSEAVR